MATYFRNRGVESARLIGEILLSNVLGCDRLRLYMEADRPAGNSELTALRAMVARVGRHEPVQYVVGTWDFRGRPFKLGSGVLVPRPSTECVVEAALRLMDDHCPTTPPPLVADIGTGSGVIAISVALDRPSSTVVATDISKEALEFAQANAEALGASERIEFRTGSHFEPLNAGECFDLIIANPPYISDAQWSQVAHNVSKYEPSIALRGGSDGLDHLRPLIAQAPVHLVPGGFLVLEIAASQGEVVLDLALANPALTDPRVDPDHEDHPRIFIARRAD